MKTIQDELQLERYMVQRGVAKQENSERAAEEGGRGADTSYGKALTRQFIPGLVDYVEEFCAGSAATRFGKYRALLRQTSADKASLLALRAIFQDPFTDRPLPTLAKLIGSMIEDEIKFTLFQDDHEDYYEAIIRDFKNKNTVSYRHRHRVLTFKMREKEVAWTAWTADERLHCGMIMLDCILKSSDLIERKVQRRGVKTTTLVVLTASASEWITKHKFHMALLAPEFMPMIIEPDDWTSLDVGGYYAPEMRRRCSLIKTRSKIHRDILKSSDISNVYACANILQKTAWRVNRNVHDVVKTIWKKGLRIGMGSPDPIDIPKSPVSRIDKDAFTPEQQALFDEWRREAARLHTLENDRVKSNFQVIRLMRAAEQYREYDKFWYVYQTDFRGRFYAATAGFSPQGPDMGKALIEFADGGIMGDEGFYWLKVHFANLCGVDKVTNDERVKYTDDLRTDLVECAKDPLGDHRAVWVNAEKPFCALAALFELAEAYVSGPDKTINRIAPARDGSCNGLQHYAAILRDTPAAEATNVVYTGVVADIYAKVGVRCGERLHQDKSEAGKEYVARWLQLTDGGGLPRKLAKKPVMTLPYGSTQRSCTDSILDYLSDIDSPLFPPGERMGPALYLTKHLWAAIGDVVTSARSAMDWLQKVASTLAKKGEPLIWVTPTGFPVYQGTNKIKTRRIRTHLGGDLQMQIGDFTDEFDPRRQASGSAPNYVHSMDASHLTMTVLAAYNKGVTNFAVVHDSYGTHAAQTPELDLAIRESFVELYDGWEPLMAFWEAQCLRTGIDLPKPPAVGDFNVREVLNSPYFFG